jgi:hypothetical protein
MNTLTPTQRERLLAALGARQAAEEGKDYPTPPPDPPEALRLPDPWYRRFRDELPGFGLVLLECLTGRPFCKPRCEDSSCRIRAAQRKVRFYAKLGLLFLVVLIGSGLWIGRPQ